MANGLQVGKTARITKKLILELALCDKDFVVAFDDWGSSSTMKNTKAPALIAFAIAWASNSDLPGTFSTQPSKPHLKKHPAQ